MTEPTRSQQRRIELMKPQPLDLDTISERVERATPGEWQAAIAPPEGETLAEYVARLLSHGEGQAEVVVCDSGEDGFAYLAVALVGNGPNREANAAFIAAARTDVPALLERVRADREALEFVRRRLEEAGGHLSTLETAPVGIAWRVVCDALSPSIPQEQTRTFHSNEEFLDHLEEGK